MKPTVSFSENISCGVTMATVDAADDSESEDADADNQNIKIPGCSEALVMSDQLCRFFECQKKKRVNVQLYRQIGGFHC
ncbi:hypothetical protein T4B_107 [Trichinella pseudospiralis]|nr:hypothetical protein T4D_5820 [Trichinella pseudospiralis]KRZ18525.1 hypothetical protein T4B_107 [Trichinella pseudospiralis]